MWGKLLVIHTLHGNLPFSIIDSMKEQDIISYRKKVIFWLKDKHGLKNGSIARILSRGISKEGVRQFIIKRG